jgi:hypothetical protein
VRATSATASPALIRSIAAWRGCTVSFFGRPKRTPRALARSLPSPVRARMCVRSNLSCDKQCRGDEPGDDVCLPDNLRPSLAGFFVRQNAGGPLSRMAAVLMATDRRDAGRHRWNQHRGKSPDRRRVGSKCHRTSTPRGHRRGARESRQWKADGDECKRLRKTNEPTGAARPTRDCGRTVGATHHAETRRRSQRRPVEWPPFEDGR